MKNGLYSRIAASNLIKNRRLYIPHILTTCGLTCVFYIILTLSLDNRLKSVRGGRWLPTIMLLGVFVTGVLSVILMLYINSFLMKQRKHEFGLYNILGLEKRHIIRILFFETLFSALTGILSGLIAGILLYKLCALIICRLLMVDSVLGFYHLSPNSLIPAALFFAAIYLAAFLIDCLQIMLLDPLALLQSVHVGEKEPKTKWICLILGILSLGGGYYIALSAENPLLALNGFFPAVLLVIAGTYFLFMAGSIALIKTLKKNKRYYYHKRHMISLSGLLYRMKQNAVGLASVAVLATCVLVMVSSTISLYAGIEDTIRLQNPFHLSINAFYYTDDGESSAIPNALLMDMIREQAAQNDVEISFMENLQYLIGAYVRDGNALRTDPALLGDLKNVNIDNIVSCFFITAEQYERLTGTAFSLSGQEAVYYAANGAPKFKTDTLVLGDTAFHITDTVDVFPVPMSIELYFDCYGIIVKDTDTLQQIYDQQLTAYGGEEEADSAGKLVYSQDAIVLNFANEKDAYLHNGSLAAGIRERIYEYAQSRPDSDGKIGFSYNCIWDTEEYLYGMYGTLFFLGLLLSIVFLFATALIIYYKQISEGYEDRERFQILQKVGMSQEEIRSAINSQVLLVFFLPLIVSAVHISVAFPILTRLLRLLFQTDPTLFLGCTVATFALFAVIYILIYGLTARVYYHIVK